MDPARPVLLYHRNLIWALTLRQRHGAFRRDLEVQTAEALCLVLAGLTGAGLGGARHPVLCEVDVAHVGAAAAESVGAVLYLRRRGGNHTTVVMAVLLVADVSPTAYDEKMQMVE